MRILGRRGHLTTCVVFLGDKGKNSPPIYLLIAWGLLTESSKRTCPESCFFLIISQFLCVVPTYFVPGCRNILLIEDLVRLRAQKHKPTMTSADSPRAADPKMVESPASMVHVSSSYACAEDGYFKRPHTASIDGDIWLDSCWFFVGFGVGGRLTRD